jgi:hypothetical protein
LKPKLKTKTKTKMKAKTKHENENEKRTNFHASQAMDVTAHPDLLAIISKDVPGITIPTADVMVDPYVDAIIKLRSLSNISLPNEKLKVLIQAMHSLEKV